MDNVHCEMVKEVILSMFFVFVYCMFRVCSTTRQGVCSIGLAFVPLFFAACGLVAFCMSAGLMKAYPPCFKK